MLPADIILIWIAVASTALAFATWRVNNSLKLVLKPGLANAEISRLENVVVNSIVSMIATVEGE